jgi:GNAT superfamily N-acetyltransferase
VQVRALVEDDLDSADRIMRLAFGTIRGLRDPATAFGDADLVRTRFRAAPDSAWVAELDGDVVGSVFAARWGSFAFFGPLTVHPDFWDRGIGQRLLEPVLDAFARWEVRQAGLFTFPDSPKHLGLYQKHGFWPRTLTAVLAKPVAPGEAGYTLFSEVGADLLEEIRELTNSVFPGLDLEREILAVARQELGDTILVRGDGPLDGVAVCHRSAGSEAGSGTCYVKFGAARPGANAAERFERLLDACESYAAASGAERLVAGVNTGRLEAYRRLLGRAFRTELIGVSMHLRPNEPAFDTPADYVLDDLR